MVGFIFQILIKKDQNKKIMLCLASLFPRGKWSLLLCSMWMQHYSEGRINQVVQISPIKSFNWIQKTHIKFSLLFSEKKQEALMFPKLVVFNLTRMSFHMVPAGVRSTLFMPN
jgi:hypothetical protein